MHDTPPIRSGFCMIIELEYFPSMQAALSAFPASHTRASYSSLWQQRRGIKSVENGSEVVGIGTETR